MHEETEQNDCEQRTIPSVASFFRFAPNAAKSESARCGVQYAHRRSTAWQTHRMHHHKMWTQRGELICCSRKKSWANERCAFVFYPIFWICQFEQCKINKWKNFAISLFTSLPQFVIDVQNDFHFSKWQCALYWVSNVTDFSDFFFWYTFFKLISLRSYRIERSQSAKDISPYKMHVLHSNKYSHITLTADIDDTWTNPFTQTACSCSFKRLVQCISRTFDSISLHCKPKNIGREDRGIGDGEQRNEIIILFFQNGYIRNDNNAPNLNGDGREEKNQNKKNKKKMKTTIGDTHLFLIHHSPRHSAAHLQISMCAT